MELYRTKRTRYRGRSAIRRFEHLERREMLDGGGLLWTDTSQLTLSFAPDGTDIAGHRSELFAKLDALADRDKWTEAILTAFQVWAKPTTANIGVVREHTVSDPNAIEPQPLDATPDDGGAAAEEHTVGYPFGTPGPRTEDPRFGDIRIGARPLSRNVAGIAISNDTLTSGTWSGDVIFNSNVEIDSLDQLYALALHEAGHVFGLDHSDDPRSPMYDTEIPRFVRPTVEDRAEMKRRHGTRVRDQYDLGVGNDSIDLATAINVPATVSFNEGSVPAVLFANLHSGRDIDYYRLPQLSDYQGEVKIQLKTRGISLLSPKLTLVTADGQVLQSRSAKNPAGASLTMAVELRNDRPNEYFLIVESAREPNDLFSVGDYSLAVSFTARNVVSAAEIDSVLAIRERELLQDAVTTFFDESTPVKVEPADMPETPQNADFVEIRRGFAPFTFYEAIDAISGRDEIDFFRINTIGLADARYVNIGVRPLRNGRLIPRTFVLDEARNVVPSETLVNGNGELIIQAHLRGGRQYAIGVAADDALPQFQKGDYRLTVYFTNDEVVMETYATGTVSLESTLDRTEVKQSAHRLFIGQSQLFHFSLTAEAMREDLGPQLTQGITAYFTNQEGETVHQITTPAGKTRTAYSVFLTPGVYTVLIFPLAIKKSEPNEYRYLVKGTQISDPFSIDPDDITDDPFDCPDEEGLFCYPGGIKSEDPFVWEDFLNSLPEVPSLPTEELIAALLGEWWFWYWNQSAENGPALASDDFYSTSPNQPLDVNAANGVLANDVDPEGDQLTATLHDDVRHGLLELDVTGAFYYAPDEDFIGVDQFVYVAYDFNQDPVTRVAAEFGIVSIEVVGHSGVLGDFDGNGSVDISDVDALSTAIQGIPASIFDLDQDGEVNDQDLEYLIHHVIGTVRGDANLDGVFRSDDLIDVFAAAEYEDGIPDNSTWATGDWNADGEFNSSDLVLAFQDGGYSA